MKQHILFPYWCRYLGWGMVIAHIPISIIGRMNGMINLLDNPAGSSGLFSGEHLFFTGTTLLMTLGLFFLAFARERIEDEQIGHIRLDCLPLAIFINYLILIIILFFFNQPVHITHLTLSV